MNEDEFKKRMRDRWMERGNKQEGRRWTGVFLLGIGALLLARAGGVVFPEWFFSGPVLLIAIGFFVGAKHRFRNRVWVIPVLIGGALLADRLSPDINLRPYIWPALLIGTGLVFIFRPKGRNCRRGGGRDDNPPAGQELVVTEENATVPQPGLNAGGEMIDITAIFGGVKKNVLSKNFSGGDITAFMGGAEINFTQADFKGTVSIDCFNMFGGTKLIIPPDWNVQSDIVTIFGGVDDKRSAVTNIHPDKILYLDGTCLFGGVEIKSY